MTQKVTKLEDIGDERDQKVFAAIAKKWFGGDMQAMLDEYNRIQVEHERLDAEIDARNKKITNANTAEVRLRIAP